MILRTFLSSSPSFFPHRSTPQTVLLSVCTHSFVSNCYCNCTHKCVTAQHELMVEAVRIRRRPSADNCSVLFRISFDICEPAANSLKCVNNVKCPFQTPDKWYMFVVCFPGDTSHCGCIFHSPVPGFSLLVFEVSRSHTTTRHSR